MKAFTALALVCLVFCGNVAAQNRRKFKAADVELVRDKAKNKNSDAILELGFRRDKTSVGMLKEIANQKDVGEEYLKKTKTEDPRINSGNVDEERRRQRRSREAAKKALAKMGEEPYFADFIANLSTTTPSLRTGSIAALGYVGDVRAVKHLAPLLFDNKAPKISGHLVSMSDSFPAADALGSILPGEFEKIKKAHPNQKAVFVLQWREWWLQNKDKYK